MVRFVGSDTTGLPLKRKQVSNACHACRRRKKRCVHTGAAGSDPQGEPVASRPPRAPRKPADAEASLSSSSSSTAAAAALPSRTRSGSETRFVGDLDPAHLLISATHPCTTSRDATGNVGVGLWRSHQAPPPSSYSQRSAGGRRDTTATNGGGSGGGAMLHGPVPRGVQQLLEPYVRRHCLTCRPPRADVLALRRIYLERLDPVFPAVGHLFASAIDDELVEVVLDQVVSLAAASDPDAGPHLRLGGGEEEEEEENPEEGRRGDRGRRERRKKGEEEPPGPLLDRREFCSALSSAVRTTLNAGFITDRIALTRLLLVFSLYMQPSGAEEGDLPLLTFHHAVHQMHTLGLHMAPREDAGDPGRPSTLFCCLWALDRIHAATHGRALLIHERDLGCDLDACIASQRPPFRLFLAVTKLLDEVIGLYRPTAPTTHAGEPPYVEMPIIEQMMIDAGATRVSPSILLTLEVYYHAVSILSCRLPSWEHVNNMPAPSKNSRRSLSAQRITEIVGASYPEGAGAGAAEGAASSSSSSSCCRPSQVPVIPYGVSLSLSVAYQKLRSSQVPMFRSRGKVAFERNTRLLQRLGDTFWTARVLGSMAEQVLQQMDKAAASMAGGGGGGGGGGQEDGQLRDEAAVAAAAPAAAPETRDEAVTGAPPEATAAAGAATTVGAAIGPVPAPAPVVANGAVVEEHGGNSAEAAALTFSGLEDSQGLDIFGYLDPSFDLGAVDAALEGNLDIGMPYNWFDWQQGWS